MASSSTAQAAVADPGSMERRESPRLRLPRVDADVVSLGVPAKVLDIGFGGMSIETDREFTIGDVHMLRARTSATDAAPVRVKVRHCRRVISDQQRPRYVTGFEYVDLWCPGDCSPADEFISRVTDGISKAKD